MDERENENGEQQPVRAKSNPLMKILPVIIIVLVGAVAAFVIVQRVLSPALEEIETEVEESISSEMLDDYKSFEYYNIEDIFLPIVDGDKDITLFFSIALKYQKNEELRQEIEARLPHIKDIITTVIRSKNFSEIRDSQSIEKIKKEIEDKINLHLESGRIMSVNIPMLYWQ